MIGEVRLTAEYVIEEFLSDNLLGLPRFNRLAIVFTYARGRGYIFYARNYYINVRISISRMKRG